jgi:GH43 family beta-xylosidase
VFAFTVFFVYDQYETEIDGFAKVLFNRIEESMGLLTRNLSASGSSFLLKCDRFHRNKVPAAVQHQR